MNEVLKWKESKHCAKSVWSRAWCSLAVTSRDPPLPETQILHLLHKVVARILLQFPSSSYTWLHSRLRQGLELAAVGLYTAAHSPRLSSAGFKEPPPSHEAGPRGPHRAAHPASQLEGGLAAQKPQLYLSSRGATTASSDPHACKCKRQGAGARWPNRSMGRAGQARAEGTTAERRIGGEKRAGLQEGRRRGRRCSSAHSEITNTHRVSLPAQGSWYPNWGKSQCSGDSHYSIWLRLPLHEKSAHWERQFGVSQWKNPPNAF